MKQILLHNWQVKLTCLVLAAVVWYVIKHNVDPGGERRTGTSERARQ
jgi:YbbR domain-containing protein